MVTLAPRKPKTTDLLFFDFARGNARQASVRPSGQKTTQLGLEPSGANASPYANIPLDSQRKNSEHDNPEPTRNRKPDRAVACREPAAEINGCSENRSKKWRAVHVPSFSEAGETSAGRPYAFNRATDSARYNKIHKSLEISWNLLI
jgi:hypothetical protein